MNQNLEKIYSKLEGSVSSKHVSLVLGDVIAKALTLFEREYYDKEATFDFSRLLIESLDNTALLNDKFVEILIMDVLEDEDISALLSILNSNDTRATFSNREQISSRSRKIKAKAIAELLDLELDYFIDPTISEKTKEHELVTPYSPIDRNDPDIDIPKEFLCLHNYQKRVKDTSTKLLIEDEKKRFLIHMPTGSGKTKTCVESMIDYMRTVVSEEGFIIWFAHSKELCEQSYDTLKNMWQFRGDEPLDFYKVFGDTDINTELINKKRAVLFIGFQKFNSILSSSKAIALSFRTKIANQAKLVVVDEAHKSMAPTYKSAIDYCQSNFSDCKLIGLTATPGRSNEGSAENVFLANYFDDTLISIKDENGVIQNDPLTYLQQENVLAEIDKVVLEFDLMVNSRFPTNPEELSQTQIDLIANQAVINPTRNIQILESVKECLNDESKESILIFAGSTDHCVILKMIFNKEGIESQYVLGSTGKEDRNKIISDFKDKKLKVLINYSVLSTGFDAPKLNTLIIARTINSNILGSQIIGRALRGEKNGGNKKNQIIVLKDNLTGLDPSFLFSYWEEFWGSNI